MKCKIPLIEIKNTTGVDMKGFLVFSSLLFGFIFSVELTTAHSNTLPVMESHGSLKINASVPNNNTNYNSSAEELKNPNFYHSSNGDYAENHIIEKKNPLNKDKDDGDND